MLKIVFEQEFSVNVNSTNLILKWTVYIRVTVLLKLYHKSMFVSEYPQPCKDKMNRYILAINFRFISKSTFVVPIFPLKIS